MWTSSMMMGAGKDDLPNFVAVGNSGKISTSKDGLAWTAITTGFSDHLNSVAYADGVFMVGGASGFSALSSNGRDWTPQSVFYAAQPISDISAGNGVWLTRNGSSKTYRSVDLSTWEDRGNPAWIGGDQYSLTFANGLHLMGSALSVMRSTDGISWTRGIVSIYPQKIAYGNGIYIAGGNGQCAVSTNASTWADKSFPLGQLTAMCFGNSLFVAGNENGEIATTPDGESWTVRTSPFGGSVIYGITFLDGVFVAVGNSGKLAASPDGIDWTLQTSGFGSSRINAITARI